MDVEFSLPKLGIILIVRHLVIIQEAERQRDRLTIRVLNADEDLFTLCVILLCKNDRKSGAASSRKLSYFVTGPEFRD